MLKIVRRLGLGLFDAPLIPEMRVVDWRIVETRTSKAIIALCHQDSALYVTVYEDKLPPNTSQLTESSSVVDPENELRLDSVDLANIYPAYTAQFALYCKKENKVRKAIYVKHTKILDLVAAKGMSTIQAPHAAELAAHEASICEWLSLQPHPSIAEYLGVQVRDKLEFSYQGCTIAVPLAHNSVVGLVFKRYDCTLHELVIRRQKLDMRLCLQAVSAGIQHLHNIGIVHGDIRPHNVYVERGDRDQFVVGDFAGAHRTGSVVTFKTRDSHWSKRKTTGVDFAQEEDDWFAFRKLMEWLVGEKGGKLEDYRGIGRAARKS